MWVSCLVVQLSPIFATLRTVAHQALLSMGFSRQEYWSRLSFPPPGDLPDPGIKSMSPAFPCIDKWIPYHCEKPIQLCININV